MANRSIFMTCFILFLLFISFHVSTARPLNVIAEVTVKDQVQSTSAISQRWKEHLKPLFFNVLPRGNFPPSGPSKGTNEIQN
ncbi:hypothetical protein IHE45_19G119200 [Dioscorea alata]|uniref:Uncharacterized protein n=1 Tax=Dioscorea alata TaxID=55571 RepID=A0ACB7U154_DIOAL|nr:hypothetical protein IHE45_19G119200 [Dioscorea alata]